MGKDATKLAGLDGLRGLAVLAVILFHHRLAIEAEPVHSTLYRLLAPTRLGLSGVHLFLVLSGFCLTHSLIRRARSGRVPSLRAYLAARWWRIAPPFYAAMGLYLVMTELYRRLGHPIPALREASLRRVVSHALFLHGLRGDTLEAINSPFWSLSLEFQFYATLPLLFAMAERFGYRRVVLGVAAASLAWRVAVDWALAGDVCLINGFFLGRWTEFALGMAIAAWYHREDRPAPGPWAAHRAFLAAVVGLGLGLGLSVARPSFAVDFLIGAGFAAMLVAVLLSSERGGRLGRIVASRPLAALGVVSYSLYLTHSLAIEWAIRVVPHVVPGRGSMADAARLLAALGAIMVLGLAFYAGVARRFLRSVDARAPGSEGLA